MTRRTTLDLGHRVDDDALVRLPDTLVTEATAVIGRRGSGKTNTGRVLAEGLHACGQQVVILDPLDAWWGLKTGADGDPGHGLPILVIGDERRPHTDLPLRPEDGRLIADFLVDERVSAILSLRHLSKTKARAFAADFAERTYERKGDPGKATPCCYFLDEAATLCPQKIPPQDINAARMVGAFESWVRQGRSSGIGCVLIDQRPASVNKDVLTQVEILLCGQLIHKLDRKAVEDWVQANDLEGNLRAFMESLGGLQTGEAWQWSPGWLKVFQRVRVKLADTFDSSRTPSLDDAGFVPTDLASVDLDAFRDKLSDAVAQAQANDPKKLKARVAELEQQLNNGEVRAAADLKSYTDAARTAGYQQSVRDAVDTMRTYHGQTEAQAREYRDRLHDRLTDAVDDLLAIAESVNAAHQALQDRLLGEGLAALESIAQGMGGDRPAPDAPPRSSETRPRQRRDTDTPGPARENVAADKPEWFQPAHKKILNAIAWCESVGMDKPDRAIVAALAGVRSKKSSSFQNNVSRLNSNGFLSYPTTDRLALEDLGRSYSMTPGERLDLAALHEAWRNCPALQPAHVRLLNAVIEMWPDDISREDLAASVEPSTTTSSSSFQNNVSRLTSLGLIDKPRRNHVRATTLLFPEGLA
ncbi:MAG: hypothetical protein AAF842_10665 [Planctomycetota bacterium]